MGNKQLGKDVDRKSKKPVMPLFAKSEISNMFEAKDSEGNYLSALDYLKGRMDYREKLEQWGYIWAH
jgi:hypothetical protein